MLRQPLLVLTASLALAASVAAQPRGAVSFDRYGYEAYVGNSAQCGYDPIDIGTGDLLVLTAASESAAASDDGAALVTLAAPFELFGVSLSALVASSNGYLAAADALASEDGADFSGDCPLPAIADNARATQARIYAYHADLDAAPNGGTLHTQYFAACPRAGDIGIAEACTVVQWRDWSLRGQTGALNVQAILYHTTFEIALQYQTLDASLGSTATFGVQAADADSGLAAGCDGSRALSPAMAVCLFDPRHLPEPGIVDRIFSDGFD